VQFLRRTQCKTLTSYGNKGLAELMTKLNTVRELHFNKNA